jgi:hypothetical protein
MPQIRRLGALSQVLAMVYFLMSLALLMAAMLAWPLAAATSRSLGSCCSCGASSSGVDDGQLRARRSWRLGRHARSSAHLEIFLSLCGMPLDDDPSRPRRSGPVCAAPIVSSPRATSDTWSRLCSSGGDRVRRRQFITTLLGAVSAQHRVGRAHRFTAVATAWRQRWLLNSVQNEQVLDRVGKPGPESVQVRFWGG